MFMYSISTKLHAHASCYCDAFMICPPSPGVFPTPPLPLLIPRPTSFERWMGRLFAVITAVPFASSHGDAAHARYDTQTDPKVKMSFQLHSLGKNDAAKGKPQTEKQKYKWRKWSWVCQNTDRISNSAVFDTPDCWADGHHGGKRRYFLLYKTKLNWQLYF